jgi:hypothetical protein
MTKSSEAVQTAPARSLRLNIAGRRGRSAVGVEQPLPALLYELAAPEARRQHERLVAARAETLAELKQLGATLPQARADDAAGLKRALRRGVKPPASKAPDVEVAVESLRTRAAAFDELVTESAQALLDSVGEERVAGAWQQAKELETTILARLPAKLRETLDELQRAAQAGGQRAWIGSLLRNGSASPFPPNQTARTRDFDAVAGDIRVALERLERAVIGGAESATLAMPADATWRMDPARLQKPVGRSAP